MIASLLFGCFFACGEEESPQTCGAAIAINDQRYDAVKSDQFSILSAILNESCLSVTINSSGCDGDRWGHDVVASTAIAESWPVQRYIKIEFSNSEECDAVITKEVMFDLSTLQLSEYQEMIINLEGFEDQISFTY